MNKQVQRLVLAIALMGIPSINMATNKFTPPRN